MLWIFFSVHLLTDYEDFLRFRSIHFRQQNYMS